MDLDAPVLSFPEMARGMGVEGEIVEAADQIGAAIERAFAERRPYLIELVISGKP
jgi:thiamine pyrophosphate-dependent acetolactate synthase large subunit-like protein